MKYSLGKPLVVVGPFALLPTTPIARASSNATPAWLVPFAGSGSTIYYSSSGSQTRWFRRPSITNTNTSVSQPRVKVSTTELRVVSVGGYRGGYARSNTTQAVGPESRGEV